MIPAVASTDSWNPRLWVRSGATRRASAPDHPRAVHESTGTPMTRPARTRPAMSEARTTDGSHLVATANTDDRHQAEDSASAAAHPQGTENDEPQKEEAGNVGSGHRHVMRDSGQLRRASMSAAGSSSIAPTRNPETRAAPGPRPARWPSTRPRRLLPAQRKGLIVAGCRLDPARGDRPGECRSCPPSPETIG